MSNLWGGRFRVQLGAVSNLCVLSVSVGWGWILAILKKRTHLLMLEFFAII